MDNSKKSCVCLGELEKKEDCIVVTILDDSNFKMEFGRAFSHMATHILENFEWLSCKQEKGILSNSKKRIFYASLDPEKDTIFILMKISVITVLEKSLKKLVLKEKEEFPQRKQSCF